MAVSHAQLRSMFQSCFLSAPDGSSGGILVSSLSRTPFPLEVGLVVRGRVIAIKCQMPIVNPKAKPNSARNCVPQRWSSQCPAKPGSTISATTVVIWETHSIATASGGRESPDGAFMGLPAPAMKPGYAPISYSLVINSAASVAVPSGVVKVDGGPIFRFLKAGSGSSCQRGTCAQKGRQRHFKRPRFPTSNQETPTMCQTASKCLAGS